MRVPIYEAVAHYKKNNELPYTEYFGLGFFSKLSLAEKALTESKNLIGFSDLADDSFSITTHYLNDCAHIGDDISFEIINNKIYGVWYDYDIDDYYTCSISSCVSGNDGGFCTRYSFFLYGSTSLFAVIASVFTYWR